MLEHLPPAAFTVALSLLALLPAAAVTAAEGDEPAEPAVVVSGQGVVRSAPDEATVRLGVTAQETKADAAQEQVNRVANAILEGVRDLGIGDDAVQTSQLTLHPVYADAQPRRVPGQSDDGEPRIVGYRASNVVSVRLTDLAKIGPVIDAGIASGANQVQGVDFQLRDDAVQRRQALAAAVKEAHAKAETIAAALGRELGPVQRVEEGGVSIQTPRFERAAMSFRADASASTPVSAGEVEVNASVTVVYRLR
jgi:hypothetical protein